MKLKFNFILLFLTFLILNKIQSMPMGPMQNIPITQPEPMPTSLPPMYPETYPIAPVPVEPLPQMPVQPMYQELTPPPMPITPQPMMQIQQQPIAQQPMYPEPVSAPSEIMPTQEMQRPIESPYVPIGIPPQQDLQPTQPETTHPPKITLRDANAPPVFAEASTGTQGDREKKGDREKEEKPEKDIYLNFENAELRNFVDYIAKLKKINLIPDKALAGIKISLTIREPLTVEGAWNIFLTILEMSGFSIIEEPDVYKIVTKDKKLTEPLPTYINVPEDTLPNSDINIRYLKFLQNIGVNEVRELLVSMLSTPNSVVAQPEVNGLIITDKSLNIKSAMKVINELDKTGLQESVSILHLKKVNASDVKNLFDNLIKREPGGNTLARLLGKQAESTIEYFSPTTRIIAEDRTNSLILLGNQKSIKKIEDFIVNHIDTELKGTESPLHVYELQYTDATQIKDILQEITAPPESVIGQQAAKFGAVRGGVKYFRPMSFQVDKDGNRLIVSSIDKQDWKMLKRTIKDLDKPQPQVAVETMFVDVDIEDNKEFGGAFHNKKTGQIGKGIDFRGVTFGAAGVSENNDLLTNLITAANTASVGASILSFGKKDHIWAFLEAIKTMENTSVITQPFITIANNTQATITSGESKRSVSETAGTSEGFITLTADRTVQLTPQINLDGIIKFNIHIKNKEFVGSEGDTKTKSIDTNATVANGQVLVLGGFVKTKVIEQRQKTPILGDIPILGWFCKYKKRQIFKQYSFIFIAPTLIKPRTSPGVDLYTKMKLHRATKDIEEAVNTGKTPDPIHNLFFNPEGEDYSHKVVDFANARYQPTTVDIQNDPYYRTQTDKQDKIVEKALRPFDKLRAQDYQIQTKELEETIENQREKLRKLISTNNLSGKKKLANLKHKKTTKTIQTDDDQLNISDATKDKLKKLLSVNKINKDIIEDNLNKLLAHKKTYDKKKKSSRRYNRHKVKRGF